MRPAQKAPENDFVEILDDLHCFTSMRPAQKAPENSRRDGAVPGGFSYFNEAGAKSAGKRRGCRRFPSENIHFNEAGAKSAGKLATGKRIGPMPNITSMRPAQKAPENESKMPNILTHRENFNEAGAKSAGKLPDGADAYLVRIILQ